METELKLAFDSEEELCASVEQPWFLDSVEIESEKTEEYENRYVDTADMLMQASRTSLRVRHVLGQQYIHTVKTSPVTIKGAGSASLEHQGLTSRCEWNIPSDSPVFDISWFLDKASSMKDDPYEILVSALIPARDRELITVCSTAFRRTTITVRFENAVMEVCLDIGKCMAGDRFLPICEMEIELISGEWSAVSDLGSIICEHCRCHPGILSKYARCMKLLNEAEHE
ncbi:MAG: CYTH domain-containing protein [Clostridiales bacterium]|nr:CYTH domain-containing protein [Clostridiales bacterium]